ncbi:MAG: hypothetical protein AB1744_08705, partial [Candidatus Zixiibacteriota bacterium]
KRFDQAGTPRFVTFSCYHNYNLFKTEQVKDQFVLTVKGCATRQEKQLLKRFNIVIIIRLRKGWLPKRVIGDGQVIGGTTGWMVLSWRWM